MSKNQMINYLKNEYSRYHDYMMNSQSDSKCNAFYYGQRQAIGSVLYDKK